MNKKMMWVALWAQDPMFDAFSLPASRRPRRKNAWDARAAAPASARPSKRSRTDRKSMGFATVRAYCRLNASSSSVYLGCGVAHERKLKISPQRSNFAHTQN
jgi:hypothetical protein